MTDRALVHIYTLGSPRVENRGMPFQIRRRQPRALLYYLAARQGPVSRDRLNYMFWSESPESQARRRLTTVLSQLRRDLASTDLGDLLETTPSQVTLNWELTWSDAVEFRRSMQQPSLSLAELKSTMALYGGEFLEGFSLKKQIEYERWINQQKEQLERSWLAGLLSLSKKYEQQQSYQEAILHAKKYLAHDELSEEVHRQLIQLYAAISERGKAMAQFEACTRVLERELGVEPLPETKEAFRNSQSGVLPSQVIRPQASGLSGSPPFVGRKDAMHVLEQAKMEATEGNLRVLLLSGEAGIGKSRLVEDFIQTRSKQVEVYSAASYPGDQRNPYLPIREALRPMVNTLAPKRGQLPAWLPKVLTLFPEFRRQYSEVPALPAASAQEARSWMFDGVLEMLAAYPFGRRGTILCFEDLHWAHPDTLDLITFLSHHLRDVPLLLIATYRDDVDLEHQKIFVDLIHSNVCTHLPLAGLEDDDVGILIDWARGSQATELSAEQLRDFTGGNPFFILEILRSRWGVEATDTPWGQESGALPRSLKAAMARRLGHLSPQVIQVLETCAVLQKRSSFEIIRQTAGREELETVDSLDVLSRHNLISEDQEGYQINHELIRLAVYNQMSAWRKRILHGRAAEALVQSGAQDFAAIAKQYEQATPGLQPRAGEYLLKAGDRARLLYGVQEAIDCYEHAIKILQSGGEVLKIAQTQMKLGATLQLAGDYSRAHKAFDTGFRTWQQFDSPLPAEALHRAPHALRIDWYQPVTLDPGTATDTNSIGLIHQLFTGLFELQPDMGIAPAMVEHFEVSEDGMTYVFHLRRDVCWSDGEPVTAADFATAWHGVLNSAEGNFNKHKFFEIRHAQEFAEGELDDVSQVGIYVDGSDILRVELIRPTGYFPHLLTEHAFLPIPQHMLEQHGEAWLQPEHLVGNGPFLLEEWKEGQFVRLKQNPRYAGKRRGNIERIELRVQDIWDEQAQRYTQDELDVFQLRGADTHELEHMRILHANDFISMPAPITMFLGLRSGVQPFDDRQVRLALASSIDREELFSSIMQGLVNPAFGGLIPKGMPAHSADIGIKFSPQYAREMLADSGYPGGRGFPAIELLTFPGGFTRGEFLCAAWQAHLGIEAHCRSLEFAELLHTLKNETPAIFLTGWIASSPDPLGFLRAPLEVAWFGDQLAEFRSLVEQAAQTPALEERIRAYQLADQKLMEGAWLVPLNYGRQNMLVKSWIVHLPTLVLGQWFLKDAIMSAE